MLETNKVYCGDNIELIKKLDDNSIDLVVTSPPYDNLRDYKSKLNKTEKSPYSFEFETLVKELFRVLKEGGVVVWVVNDQIIEGGESGNSFRQALFFQETGFKIFDTMIYQKNGPSFPDKIRYYQIFEYMFVFSKGKPKTFNAIEDRKNKWFGVSNFGKPSNRSGGDDLKETRKRTTDKEYGVRFNIWKYNTGFNYSTKDEKAFEHPAIFPDKLAGDHIKTWTNKGDIVLDPFSGSGTTLKMALLNGRDYIGFEIVKEYYDLSKDILSNYNPLMIDLLNEGS